MKPTHENDELILADEDNEIPPSPQGSKGGTEKGGTESFVNSTATTWKVMIVDDDIEIHKAIQFVLGEFVFQGKPLTLLSAYSGTQAQSLLKTHPDTALLFLDVVMEDNHSGLRLVKYIRGTLRNHLVRIILHTGQPGKAPEEAVIKDYDINDYKLKSEMTQSKMFVTTMAGLRAYRDLIALETSQVALKQKNVQLQKEITERQRAEQELRKHRVHLEELVAKRTDELAKANVQLQQDIIKRKLVEEELRKFARAVEQSANVIIIASLSGTMEFVNSAFSMITGYSSAEAIGNNPRLLSSGKHSPEFYKTLWATLGGGKVWQGELLNKHKNGDLYWVLATLSPIKDKAGKTTHYLAIEEDITERKQAEEELRKSKELAESANRAKSAFLANMSHELRTPLNGILGYTQIFKLDKSLTAQQTEGIQIIHRCGEHLLMLINDILDLSKIEAGKFELTRTEFRLPEFLTDITNLFGMRAEQKGIEFVHEFLSQLPATVHADEKRLRQALLNLLSNAIKFTHQGQVTFKVQHTPTPSIAGNQGLTPSIDGNQATIRFDVEDSGEGIAAEHLEKIFLPFQQVSENEHNRYTEGTGLGLSITKKLVEMMGGQLCVQSTFGMGSHFWFEIQVHYSQAALYESLTPKLAIIGFKMKAEREKGNDPRGDFRILVVDDKWENRVFLKNLLIPLGFKVLEAQDGQEALTKADDFHPDAIIMDLKMPVMDGLECTRRLRQDARFQKTVIIALSANVFDYQPQDGLEAGCDAFLTKPLDIDTFLQELAKHCPLSLIYETPQSENSQTTALSPAEIIPPTVEQIKILLNFAKMGDVEAVIDFATALLENDPLLQPFIQKVCQLANDFRLKQVKELLEQYLQRI
ncbi:MAG: hypothetical protein DRR19_09055 [Candidatus Parabeggiatoa sp. nov. 1]|nr:MAG: hypothetical protein DRR19_09055 [Gammaproteobacteria bacterium]